MRSAIQLDDKLGFPAQEVSEERTDRYLPAEFVPFQLSITQTLPQQALRRSGIVAKFFGARRISMSEAGWPTP